MNKLLPLVITQLRYEINRKALLDVVNLTISDNGVCMIMGHNGAGKSLLLRCMHGLIAPTEGEIRWAQQSALAAKTRHQQAMVFQKPLMFNRSVAANINYVLKQRSLPLSLCDRYLELANLADKARQSARSLSGGEQQRLAIARALATEPEVLFLDEPTANLDPQATLEIEAQVIQAKQQSIKIIMVSHDIAQAKRMADEVVFMHSGCVAEHALACEFFRQPRSDTAREYLTAYIN